MTDEEKEVLRVWNLMIRTVENCLSVIQASASQLTETQRFVFYSRVINRLWALHFRPIMKLTEKS